MNPVLKSLLALSVGDAFGENRMRITPIRGEKYNWTDDTAMAISVVKCLFEKGKIDQDYLMQLFSDSFFADRHRGYGRNTVALCSSYAYDKNWALNSQTAFGNTGSLGNGAAMRVAPLGVYFQGDYGKVTSEARKSAEVTHWHDEAIAGAIAVAVAASAAMEGDGFWELVMKYTPQSEVRTRLAMLPAMKEFQYTNQEIAQQVGNGSQVTAPDTVPYALWCAYQGLQSKDFAKTMNDAASAGGDTDTYCAMIGGILGNIVEIPGDWINQTEPLPILS